MHRVKNLEMALLNHIKKTKLNIKQVRACAVVLQVGLTLLGALGVDDTGVTAMPQS